MTGVGKIIGGAIILLIGVIVSGWGLTINGHDRRIREATKYDSKIVEYSMH